MLIVNLEPLQEEKVQTTNSEVRFKFVYFLHMNMSNEFLFYFSFKPPHFFVSSFPTTLLSLGFGTIHTRSICFSISKYCYRIRYFFFCLYCVTILYQVVYWVLFHLHFFCSPWLRYWNPKPFYRYFWPTLLTGNLFN